jgi:hypothetical protein
VTQRLAALRFFFVKTLNRPWSANETPYPKKVVRLPAILSQEEIARLIDAAHTPFHRVVLMTLYATGVRRAELAHLKVSDIDSQRMVGSTSKAAWAAKIEMSCSAPNCWKPEHWRSLRRKPAEWLFPGNRWHTANHPIDTKVAWQACQTAAQRAGIKKRSSSAHFAALCCFPNYGVGLGAAQGGGPVPVRGYPTSGGAAYAVNAISGVARRHEAWFRLCPCSKSGHVWRVPGAPPDRCVSSRGTRCGRGVAPVAGRDRHLDVRVQFSGSQHG